MLRLRPNSVPKSRGRIFHLLCRLHCEERDRGQPHVSLVRGTNPIYGVSFSRVSWSFCLCNAVLQWKDQVRHTCTSMRINWVGLCK